MNKDILFITFNYADWELAANFELLARNHENSEWLDLTGVFRKHFEYPLSDRIHWRQVQRRFRKSNYLRVAAIKTSMSDFSHSSDRLQKDVRLQAEKQAKLVAFQELISILRDSKPCIKHNKRKLEQYENLYLDVFASIYFSSYIKRFSKVVIFNGRFIQERACWNACRLLNIPVTFYETFSQEWIDRFFLFEEPTHSPQYRSKVMLEYGSKAEVKDLFDFIKVSDGWFQDRILGKTQNFTQLQSRNLGLVTRKPYVVFFHSSQDELVMVNLVSEYWRDQFHALKILIEELKKSRRYDLVIRLHPHLLYKAKNEITIWNTFGEDLMQEFDWITFIPADGTVDTYELIKNSEMVVTSGSTVGVEAGYLAKKSILIGRAFHEEMGITINPKNSDELQTAINFQLSEVELEHSKQAARYYAYFLARGGSYFEYVTLDLWRRRTYLIGDLRIYRSFSVAASQRIDTLLREARNMLKNWIWCRSDCRNYPS